MIHGFRGTKQGLGLIAKEITEQAQAKGLSVKPFVPDIPGFGRGAHLPEYTLNEYVLWLHSYIKSVQLRTPQRKIILLGHSFGSIICAAYAARFPDTISSLILVNPIGSPALEGPKKALTALAVLYYKIGALLPEKAAHTWLSSRLIVRAMSLAMVKTKDPTIRSFVHAQHDLYFSIFHSPESVLQAFKVSVSHTVADYAPNIPLKTLLIAGSLDDITPLSDQFALAKKIPKATLKVIDNVGHLTHYETPGIVAQHVYKFIKSV